MRIGIVGAGKIGSTLAKLWVEAGHEVRLARAMEVAAFGDASC